MTEKKMTGKGGERVGIPAAEKKGPARRTLNKESGGALERIAEYFTDAEENGMLDLVKKIEETEDDVRRDQGFTTRMSVVGKARIELQVQQKALRAGRDNMEMAFHAGQVAALSWIVEGLEDWSPGS